MTQVDEQLAREFVAIRSRLEEASDRRSLSAVLDDLAVLAGRYEPALALLLTEIVRRDLAEVVVRSYFFDESLVDDAVQETVLAVARGVAGFRGEAAFLTWLDRVARHAAGRVRAQRQRAPEPLDPSDPVAVPAGTLRVSSLVADRHVIGRSLARLPAHYRDVITLREVSGLSYEEIAERLGIPLNTVRSRLRRARLQLADLLLDAQLRTRG